MVAIPGYVFIIIGVLFTAVSYYVNSSQGIASLTVFIYIGYGFIAYGLAKVIVRYVMHQKGKQGIDVTKPMTPKHNPPVGTVHHHAPPSQAQHQMKPHAHQHPTHQQAQHKAHVPPGYVSVCSGCGTPMRAVNIYCHRCGMRQHTSS